MPPVPTIYSANHRSPALEAWTRTVAGAICVACLTVLGLAAWLSPDPAGFGTHRQLGLSPCGMIVRFGLPCMTCGMTTSFTHLVHGQPLASLHAQPAGTVLCVLTALAAWAAGYVAVTGRPGAAIARRLPVTRFLLALLAIALAGWAYKIATMPAPSST